MITENKTKGHNKGKALADAHNGRNGLFTGNRKKINHKEGKAHSVKADCIYLDALNTQRKCLSTGFGLVVAVGYRS